MTQRLQNLVVLENVDISASGTTEPICLEEWDSFSATVSFIGTPTGTFKLQAANEDYVDSLLFKGLVWVDVDGSERTLSGASEDILYAMADAPMRWIRGVYNAGVGSSGLITFTIHLKRVSL